MFPWINCVIDFEHELRKQGKWEQYQRDIKNGEIDKRIEEYKSYINEKLNESNVGFVSEDGDVENWVGKLDESKVNKRKEAVIEYLESLKQ